MTANYLVTYLEKVDHFYMFEFSYLFVFYFFVKLQKLLQRGQERDQFLAQMSHKVESDHVLELRQTIQIMQEKLDEREGETL